MYNSFGSVGNSKKTLQHTKFLYLNSANRNQGDNSSPVIYFPPSLFTNNSNKEKSLKISLYSATINREWYNIIDGINNLFQYFDGVTLNQIIIPEGSYSIYSFRDYLNTVLVGTTVTYSLTTNKLTFTPINPASWINATTSGVFMGLTNGQTYTGTFTSEFPVNMLYESDIYLNSDIASGGFNIDNVNNLEVQTSTIIDKIPVTVPPFGNIIYNCNEKHASLELPLLNNLTSIRLWLTTNRLRKLDNLQQPWAVCLRIDVYQN